MHVSVSFTRILFVLFSIFFLAVYMSTATTESPMIDGLFGALLGLIFGLILIGCDLLFKRFNIRSFNTATLGVFFGYLLGIALNVTFGAIYDLSEVLQQMNPQTKDIIQILIFLFAIYLGTVMTIRASDELYVSVPFVKFSPVAQKKKDLLIDFSVLADARIIDLAATGIMDKQLIVPRFVVKDLYAQAEIGDEQTKIRAKRAMEVLKKLETMHELEIRYNDTDFPEVKDGTNKAIRLARLLDCNIMTADISRIEMSYVEGVRVINIHSLSNALKPLMQTGETIKIKIQRYGKEPRQGVGYLDDGTMVVVNDGGQFIGQTIDAHVLSVKHTSSGRMVFCNAVDGSEPDENFGKDEDEEEDEGHRH
jgi:uncharacterized protein YacL